MEKFRHTPGPWFQETVNGKNYAWSYKNKKIIALPNKEADAILIVAAPELLQACRAALMTLSDDDLFEHARETYKTLEAAIAKAEGR